MQKKGEICSKDKRLEMELQINQTKASDRLRDVVSDDKYEIMKESLNKKGYD